MLPLSEVSPASGSGRLIGIGVGPGDPELLTVKALRILQAAPVVAFPAGRKGQSGMAEQIIAPWLQAEQLRLPLEFSFAREPEQLLAAWEAAAAKVWPYLAQGHDVVFASEGDISFYSTFAYLAQTLRQHHPQISIQAIPGVCSPLAAAAVMNHPLTVQGEKLAILPALYSPQELEAVLGWAEVVVLMKVSSVYREVWEILRQRNLLQQSYVITHISQPYQECYRDLSHYADLKLPYFSLLVVQSTSNRLA
nr:precorrin-2 C(20)-methyltransferase [Pseudanabaena sp. FACHB-2040]